MIYVLRLKNEKYYVGRIDKGYCIDRRMALYSNGGGSLFVQEHGFIEQIEVIETDDIFAEMNTTLRYMHEYGIDNVRGGPWNYKNPIYKNSQNYISIQRMIQSAYNECHLCNEAGHYSTHCPNC
jgi:hypothetical protein